MKHLRILVSGKVQGVYFRASTKTQADLLGVQGFVRNEPNGDVYIEAEAEDEKITQFINWCKRGPSRARVDNLHVEEGSLTEYAGFEIRY
ncbi:acylphosphatase [Cytophagales bacterium WSM2-2]|nr:acylphosphatase [Cytophagales bacterium WSM2-2]